MFKNQIKFINDLSISKLNKNNKFFSLEDIKKSKIHPAIVKYIVSYVEQQIFLDIQSLGKNSDFDYSGSKISKYLKLITEDIKRNKKFTLDEITILINKAVIFNINYLTRPNKTLTEFIFGDSTGKNISEITQNLLFVYYYRFLPKILLTYLTKKKIKAISKIEFSILLRKIDAIARKKHLQGTLNTAIDSMANFFDMGSENAEKAPVLAVDFFLREKGLKNYSEELNERFSDEKALMFLSLGIKDVLRNVAQKEKSNTNENINADNIPNEKISIQQEIVDLEVEEEQIPNEELLSNEDNLEKQDKIEKSYLTNQYKNNETKEDLKETITDGIGSDNLTNQNDYPVDKQKPTNLSEEADSEIIIDHSNIVIAKERVETLEDLISDKHNTIKPDARAAIKELIDIVKFYNSLSNEPKPSENEILQTSINEDSNIRSSNLTDYKIDVSDLDSEFNVPDDSEKAIENLVFQSIYEKDDNLTENDINTATDLLAKEHEHAEFDIEQFNETETRKKIVDDYINEVKEEKILEDVHTEKNDSNLLDKVSSNDMTDDNDITLTDEISEEMNEVFSDITYLEKKEVEDVIENEATKTDIEEEIETPNNSEEDIFNYDNLFDKNIDDTNTEVLTDTKTATSTKTFTEVIANTDMSTIIESIFDYDMEDYHDVIINLENCKTESSAIQLVNNYCIQNNVNLSIIDVTSFKALISDYYKQPHT